MRVGWTENGGLKMDVFELRNSLIDDYRRYVTSFMSIRDDRKSVDDPHGKPLVLLSHQADKVLFNDVDRPGR